VAGEPKDILTAGKLMKAELLNKAADLDLAHFQCSDTDQELCFCTSMPKIHVRASHNLTRRR
jgi:hypothetical protein